MNLKQQMKSKGITQKLMSELTGVHYNTVWNHVTGRTKPKPKQLAKYKEVLKLS
jgi:transcriptional regulator with XRE-family HTH domain